MACSNSARLRATALVRSVAWPCIPFYLFIHKRGKWKHKTTLTLVRNTSARLFSDDPTFRGGGWSAANASPLASAPSRSTLNYFHLFISTAKPFEEGTVAPCRSSVSPPPRVVEQRGEQFRVQASRPSAGPAPPRSTVVQYPHSAHRLQDSTPWTGS